MAFPEFIDLGGMASPLAGTEAFRARAWGPRTERWLGRRDVFLVLVALHVLVACSVLWAARGTVLSDSWSYLALAEGILNGRYSMWWELTEFYPDTFRAPGYPLFVALVIKLFGSWKAALGVQFVMYWLALYFALRTIRDIDPRRAVRSLFLLLLLPLINVPFYIGQLYTEVPVLLALGIVVHWAVRPGRWSVATAVGAGLLLGFAFQCKPAFLLLPPAFVLAAWWFQRREADVRGLGLMLLVFGATLVPFGAWNMRHHGVFRVTPLDGGGGYMHFSYWCGKFPGYTDRFSLGNFAGEEILRFTPVDSIPANIARYEREWAMINARTLPLLTAKDSVMLASHDRVSYPAVENTFNTDFVLAREKLLTERGLRLMWEDPWYTLAYKSYSAVRLWVIGIQPNELREATTIGRLRMLYGTGTTALIFLLFIVLVPLAYWRRAIDLRSTWPLLLVVAYVGLVHVPFTIQSRYTVCVRFAMLALLALAAARLAWRSGSSNPDDRP